jgi:hypothetical protein
MKTSAPTKIVFILSTIIGAAALISEYVTTLPLVGGNEFLALAIAFVLLWLGVVLRNF